MDRSDFSEQMHEKSEKNEHNVEPITTEEVKKALTYNKNIY